MEFGDAIIHRRTIYSLGKNINVPFQKIEDIVKSSMFHCPTAFNSQSNKVVVLSGEAHDKFWDMTISALADVVSGDDFEAGKSKIETSFKSGFGTVLFFVDEDVTHKLEADFPTYAENFRSWGEQASGMLQFAVWVKLEEAGMGASLQHYANLVGDAAKAEWNIPKSYRLIAQMPFGEKLANAGEKSFNPIEERVSFTDKVSGN